MQKPSFKKIRYGAVIIFFSLGVSSASAQDDLSKLRELWRSGQYADVIRRGAAMRDLPYGKMAEVDYMIGTGLCRLPDQQGNGVRHLTWCLRRYSLDDPSRAAILRELQVCANALPTVSPATINTMTLQSSAGLGAGVIGKMFHHLDEDHAVRNTPIRIVAPKTLAELRGRLNPVTAPDSAVQKIARLAGSNFKVQAFGKFVIASSNSRADLPEMARRLKVYEAFFANEYGLVLPPHMVTVYVVLDIYQLRNLAKQLHGFELPSAAIGYSNTNDMSLLAFCPDRLTGTLYHELFHLMARSTFGDILPWLDEGLAALYAVSKIDGQRVVGLNSWRGEILRQLWPDRPRIENLVKMDWATFDKIEDEQHAEAQAANHAAACCFMQYLQEQGKLAPVFNALRERTPENYQRSPEGDVIAVLENVLQKNIAKIDEAFVAWFRTAEPWPK